MPTFPSAGWRFSSSSLVVLALLLVASPLPAGDTVPGITLSPEQAKRLKKDPTALKPGLDRSKRVVDLALGKGADRLQAGRLAALELAALRAKVRNDEFVGVIAEIELGSTPLSVERRLVITPRGPLNLLLTRFGDEFVYDGDLVVPPSAIVPLDGPRTVEELRAQVPVTFSAGYPGSFGRGTLWDDAILPYEVDDSFCCRGALEEVRRYFDRNTIVRLVPRDGHENYIRFVNAEWLTTSRTDLGKQAGRNEVRIQGFRYDGTPTLLESRVRSIKHELGHELGLIHEHMRPDRDKFIVRNSSCNSDGVFEYLRDVWIDAGNVAFTESGAELLTPYDFSSIMHYPFTTLLSDGSTCNAWVRKRTCANGDPTASDCVASLGGDDYTDSDIEGIHKIYAAVPGASAFLPEPLEVQTFTGDNVRLRGKRIDKCLHGLPFLEDGCNAKSRDDVADAFCRAKGFKDGFAPKYTDITGVHSGYHKVLGWTSVWGGEVISSVGCQDFTPAKESVQTGAANDDDFVGDAVRFDGRFVDRCVHGTGITGDRCSEGNQKRVADAFCGRWGYTESADFTTDLARFALEVNAAGFDVGTGRFRDVSAIDIFTQIRCVKAATQTNHRRFAQSEIRIGDKAVDRCVHGTPFGEDRCSADNQKRAANNFCQEMNFDKADTFLTSIAVNALGAGYHPSSDDFRDVWGVIDVLSSVECVND